MQTMRWRWPPMVWDARRALNPGATASRCKISRPARVCRRATASTSDVAMGARSVEGTGPGGDAGPLVMPPLLGGAADLRG
eukprot:2007826-Pyramimonas_sp.AAC.1